MIWLNINLSTLRSPAYLGADPVERATWLQLLAYCADQENGGRIAGGAQWKDRQWQQTCGVTAREVRAASRLVTLEGEDVRVAFYPVEKQAEVLARRVAGTEAANRRWHSKLGANGAKDEGGRRKDEVGDGSPIGLPIASRNGCMDELADAPAFGSRNAEGEGNGNENGMEHRPPAIPPMESTQPGVPGKRARARREIPDWGVVKAYAVTIGLGEWKARDWFDEMEGCGWLDFRHRPVCDWQAVVRRVKVKWEADGRPDAPPGVVVAAASHVNGNGKSASQRAMSAYEANTKLGAIDDELSRIRARAKDGRSGDGLRTIKIYTPEEESRRAELLNAKELLKRKLTEV